MRRTLLTLTCGLTFLASVEVSTVRQEFRALWVDTFNTPLNNHADVMRIVSGARAARLNLILAQVRRRGDAWYLNTREPAPDFAPIEPGFDPLADLIGSAHAFGIQVHAFVIAGAIWNKDPALAPPANGPPISPRHAFNLHGGYDAARRVIVQGPQTWLTRTLLPAGAGIAYQGHRILGEFWLDFGHPDAAAYLAGVLTDLVAQYDVDGLHLDRIRYPELTVTGQTPATGANIGYNSVSVARFNRRYGLPPDAQPSPGDARWSAWRRAQLTNVVRRIYLNVAAIKPEVIVSAALIAFGGGPATEPAWTAAEAYWRVYQDWRAWLEEGILDVGIPMNYKRDHDVTQARQFDEWNAWLRTHQYRRAGMIGLGAFLNTADGTLRQIGRSLEDDRGARAAGVALFSFANATDTRDFDGLAALLTQSTFQDEAIVPMLAWKRAPLDGHVMGFAMLEDETPLDTVSMRLTDLRTGLARTVETDGGGFFGFVDVAPGSYALSFAKSGTAFGASRVDVFSGRVTSLVMTPSP